MEISRPHFGASVKELFQTENPKLQKRLLREHNFLLKQIGKEERLAKLMATPHSDHITLSVEPETISSTDPRNKNGGRYADYDSTDNAKLFYKFNVGGFGIQHSEINAKDPKQKAAATRNLVTDAIQRWLDALAFTVKDSRKIDVATMSTSDIARLAEDLTKKDNR